MMLLKTAWRNIGRNKRRSVLSALAIGFAFGLLVFSMALQRGSYVDMIQNTVRVHTGHLQIQQAGHFPERLLSEKLDPAGILEAVDKLPRVVGAAPRVMTAALVSKGEHTFGAAVFGIDPEREKTVSTLASVVREGAFLAPDDREGVLLGTTLAKNLGAAVGDEIVFIGQGADGSMAAGKLIVRGLFKMGMGDLDRAAMAVHLATVQKAFSMEGGVTEIAVLLDSERMRPEAEREVRAKLDGMGRKDAVVLGWPTLMPGVEQGIRVDWNSGLIMYAALVLVVGFGIANTFLMAYMERIHELGVLLALGMPPRRLSRMVYLESVLLVGLGILVGLAGGVPITYYYQVNGIDFGINEELTAKYGMSSVIHAQLEPLVFAWAGGIVLAISLAVALYPALKAARIKPVEALRHT
ncbi:MAG TPA: ABC transporter permease [Verrucomicrobia bacterium]|nr:ABC transporter permease [Verrucomicrobiota bacterium]